MKEKLIFVVNTDKFFMSHRLPIALAALQKGFEVHVATALTNRSTEMQALGLVVHPLDLSRRSANIFSNGLTFFQIWRIFRRVRPDIVHLVTIKPILFGGLVARFLSVRGVVAAISGLGFVFLSSGVKAMFRRWLVVVLYRVALGHRNLKVIFQNVDDREKVVRLTGISMSNTTLIKGSGVNLNDYSVSPMPLGVPVVMMAARLLVDKGVREFIDAARLLQNRGANGRFVLVGDPDPGNPATICHEELKHWVSKGVIEHWGHRDDMPCVLSKSTIVVLPSYMEGLPKVLLEAAACGRPVITTDVPGCRDAIVANETGILVPVHDSIVLAESIEMLMKNQSLCEAMGRAGRVMVENRFDLDSVIMRHLLVYDELLMKAS